MKENEVSDPEIAAILAISQALGAIDELPTRIRVLNWAMSRFGSLGAPTPPPGTPPEQRPQVQVPQPAQPVTEKDIPGVAQLSGEGEVKITIRDLKASSTNDAAKRLVLTAIRAHERLKGVRQVSSREVIVPLMRDYRVYTGNTRTVIKNYKGIIRDGDMLSLDVHAREEADRFLEEITDPEKRGTWKPGTRSKRTAKRTKAPEHGSEENGGEQ